MEFSSPNRNECGGISKLAFMNVLFVCSRNKWRSRTAEEIFKNHGLHQIRSAGTAASARIPLSQKLVNWADLIFVMEKRHKVILLEKFAVKDDSERIIIMEIPDEYTFMDEELIAILKAGVEGYLD